MQDEQGYSGPVQREGVDYKNTSQKSGSYAKITRAKYPYLKRPYMQEEQSYKGSFGTEQNKIDYSKQNIKKADKGSNRVIKREYPSDKRPFMFKQEQGYGALSGNNISNITNISNIRVIEPEVIFIVDELGFDITTEDGIKLIGEN